MSNKRKDYHLGISYQYRMLETNLATLEEERKLSVEYGIQSCEYERWVNETIAMTFSAKENDLYATIMAVKHLIKMIIRKHTKRQNIKIVSISVDTEIQENFYETYIAANWDS